MVSTRSSRSGYPFTHRSMGMSPPLLLHWYRGGHRGGGGTLRIFSVVFGSLAGKPGRVLVSPCSIPAQGSAQTPRGKSTPRWSCCLRHTCAAELQSARFVQLRPMPTVRESLRAVDFEAAP